MLFRNPPVPEDPCNAQLAERIEVLIKQNDKIINQNNIIIDLLLAGSLRDIGTFPHKKG